MWVLGVMLLGRPVLAAPLPDTGPWWGMDSVEVTVEQ